MDSFTVGIYCPNIEADNSNVTYSDTNLRRYEDVVYGACDAGWEVSLDVFHFSMTCSSIGVWDPPPQCNSACFHDIFLLFTTIKISFSLLPEFVISLKKGNVR